MQTIPILLNGERTTVPAGQTIAGLLEFLGIDAARVAVEMDRKIVKQTEWPAATLSAGTEIEIVQFVGGG